MESAARRVVDEPPDLIEGTSSPSFFEKRNAREHDLISPLKKERVLARATEPSTANLIGTHHDESTCRRMGGGAHDV